MPKPLNIFHSLPPACDEWKLEAALIEAGYPVRVVRDCRNGVKISPAQPVPAAEVRAFVAGWVAGALAT
jgi:hypothetical protein